MGLVFAFKHVLQCHGLRGWCAKKEEAFVQDFKARLKFAVDHMDKEKNFWRKTVCQMKQKLSFLATMSSNMFRGDKVRHLNPKNLLSPTYCQA